jgi:hypothetical protein
MEDARLVWHEVRRFVADDGLVHVTMMQMVNGEGGRSRWWNCGVHTGATIEGPITCLTCLARRGG